MKTPMTDNQVVRCATLVFDVRHFAVFLFLFFSGILSAQTTLYSYQSGNWNASSTWTSDPSGTLFVNPSSLTPGTGIRVVILNGRTVAIPAGLINQVSNGLDVQEGGILTLGLTTGHSFGNVTGKGTIKMEAQTTTFGAGTTFTTFVAQGGGTFELNNSSSFNLPSILNQCNNLVINNSASEIVVTLRNNLTINGNFEIRSGTFKINNDASTTPLTITLLGNLEVGAAGNITTGQGNASGGHNFIIKGDFTNNGNVRFSNLATYSYHADPSNGYVHAIFNNDKADQYIQCNNITSFYRIEIAKGVDKTYVLNIDAASSSYFLLLGHNFKTPNWTDDNTGNHNSLGLESGTCRLGSNIVIPCLTTGFYFIKEPACLWLDGAQVVFKDASYPTHPLNEGIDNCGLYVYGALKMTGNSSFIINSFAYRGMVSRGSASVEFRDNAVFSASMFRTSESSTNNRGAFILRDNAKVTLTGNTYNEDFATFDMGYPDNMVEISGGTLSILAPTTTEYGALRLFSLHVACEQRNINVTGGTININLPSNIYLNSNMPFWNLNFTSASAGYCAIVRNVNASATPAQTPQPLVVKNDLSLNNYAQLVLNNTNGTPSTVDLSVGRNFTIQNNAVYTPGNNTTTYNGKGGQSFANNGTITSGLYNMVLSGAANVSIARDLSVRGILTLNSGCILNDVGHYITVNGDIYNNGLHTSQAGGGIVLGGSTLQNLTGSGEGAFGNLIQNNSNGAALKANQTFNGDLRLVANATLNIRSYNLALSANSKVYSSLTTTAASFSSSRMITTSGLESDGGITKYFSTSNRSFLYPFGISGKYTPAKISVNTDPTTYGSVTIRPVNYKIPFASSNNILNYYWKTRSAGFTGIAANSIRHAYIYFDGDVVPANYDNNYVAGAYLSPAGWTSWAPDESTVDENNDTIKFPTTVASGISFIDGDFTAGAADAFSNVVTYYSAQSGDWNDPDTWSTDSVGGPSGSTLPGSANPVVIGDGIRHFHTVTVPSGFNNIVTGSLRVNNGSVLDLTTTTGHNFGSIPESKITGIGRIRISSATPTAEFPRGDFGLFLNQTGGTIEYYSTATSGANTISINNIKADGISLTTYKNLVLSPWTGKNISLPNTNLTVYGDLIINETTAGTASLSTSSVSYTLTVKGNTIVNSGTFLFPNTNPQRLVAENDVIIHPGASFTVFSNSNSVDNTLIISGNLENNGTVDMHPDANPHCDLTFIGINNKEIKGTTAVLTRLNAITVDKGNSRAPVLDVTVNDDGFSLNTALSNALTLTNGTFRLTTPTTINLSTAALTIPVTGCLSSNGGTFNLCTANSDASDLYLNGRLEVLAGAVNIGAPANTNNNDLEYASAGIPELVVRGGTLNVYGQIRRDILIETGSLNYTQSGGQVFIYGRDAQNARGMLEIENAGSLFRMSGGTLTLVRSFNNASYDDLYLMPDASDVSGGTIRLGTPSSTASQFYIVAASPVWNLVIDGNTTIKTVNLKVSPLTVLNDLTIGNSSGVNSVLNTNGLDVTIGHNLYNYNSSNDNTLTSGGFQAYSPTQLTTFNGSSNQLISGVSGNITNFANLAISNSSQSIADSLAAGISNIRVNGNLTISSGILADGGNTITLTGNLINTATHRSPGVTGGIRMQGSQKQFISGDGNGSFGNIQINNANGVDLLDNATVNGRLTLSTGLFYINDMLLTMGASSSIGGTPGSSNMIRTNGALSDFGVKKLFASGASSFTYPLGVTGKYTPVTFNITANSYTGTSSVTVKPVNSKHPATYELTPAIDELQYYWNVTSTGFNNGVIATHTYNYINGDAEPADDGYVVGRYNSFIWTTPAEGAVDSDNNRFALSSSANIDGEYTCGRFDNFRDLQTFYSRNLTAGTTAGAPWNSATSWTLLSDGSGGPAPYAPNGNPLVILPDHKINATTDGNKAYSILLNGTLDLGSTVNHSHGHVSGNGKLIIKSTDAGYFVFPGGAYDEFMKTEGTIVEFVSAIPATLPNAVGTVYKPFQNVRFKGTGTKYMSCVNMKVLGDLEIRQGYLNNSLANKNIHLLGDWADSTSNGFVAGKGLVSFEGSNKQITRINTGETFYSLRMDNAQGDSLVGIGASNVLGISENLYLVSGKIVTDAGNMLHVTNGSTDAVIGGSSASFVKGPMRKTVTSGSYFEFPIGKNNRYGKIHVSGLGSAGVLEAEYYTANPYNVSSKLTPIDTVTNKESWRINCSANTTGRVQIRWDSQSDIIPTTAIGRTKLRVVGWNGSAWANKGGVGNGTLTAGTIQSDSAIRVYNNRYYTIGLESLPTAYITSGDVSLCNNGVDNAAIQVELTGTAPWTLKYRTGTGEEQTVSNIGFSPATLVLNSSSPGISGTGVYPFGITYVCDGTGSTGTKYFTKKINITVLESPSPSINGKSPVSQNEAPVRYSVTNTTGHSYAWMVTGGTITSGQGSSQITVEWGTGTSGIVQVTETITATGCQVTVSRNIVINPAPSPVIVGNNQVCSGSIETYSTGEAATHQFVWTVTGGTIRSTASGLGINSIQVSWNQGVASGSVKVSEAIVSPYGVGCDSIDVIINPLPDDELVVSDPVICYGTSASIVVENAEGGMDYTLRLNTDNSVVSTFHTSAPGDVDFSVSPLTDTLYNILATNEYGCSNVLMDLASVTVRSVPTVADAGGDQTDLCGTASTTLAANAPSEGTGSWTIISGTGGTLGSTSNPESSFTGISGNSYTLQWAISNTPCPASTDDVNITFNSTTLTTADAGEDQTGLCGLTGTTLTANTPTDGLGQWSIISGTGGSFSSDALPGAVFTGMADSTYVLRWTISKAPCRASTDDVTITFPKIPETSPVTGNATPTCEATGVTYSVTAHPGSSYAWSVPDHAVITSGQTGPGNNSITVDFSNWSGHVSVVETSASGCAAEAVHMQVDMQGCTLIPDFVANVTMACVNEEIVFSDRSQGVNSATVYQWIFGDGADTVTASGPGPHHVVYTTPGPKTVQLIISNGTPETITRTNYITIHDIPVVSVPDISRCGPGMVNLVATPVNGDRVDFSTDAGATIIYSDNTDPYTYSFETSALTVTQIWARAYNTLTGCTGTWDSSAIVQAFAGPTTEAIASDYTGTLPAGYIDVVCHGSTIVSTYSVKGGGDPTAIYNWSIPALDTIIANKTQFSIVWNAPAGDYTLELQKISSDGCSGTIRDTLVMIARPAVDLGDDVSLCQGADHTFQPGTFASYLWQNNTTARTYTATTSGKVYVRVTDAYGCMASDTAMVIVHSDPVINLGNDTVLCGSSTLQLDAGNFAGYLWSTGENTNPITVHAGAGHVSVTVTDENGCQAADEIVISDCTPVNLIHIPNTFTPNDDNYHDSWVITNIGSFPDAKILVYDRWGRVVFKCNGGYNNDWKGTNNGNDLPVDTYFYVIDLNVPESGTLTGTVSIIR